MMRIYVGYDPRDEMAFRACVASIRETASVQPEIYPLKEYDLRRRGIYSRAYTVESSGQMIDSIDRRPFSTQFTFTRFAVPIFDKSDDYVLFVDADFLFRRDVNEILTGIDRSKPLLCVQHDYKPPEGAKFDGMLQQQYKRKNWSSLMLMRPRGLNLMQAELNNASGRYLHQFQWMEEDQIGALPPTWNCLEGWHTDEDPAAIHYTRGTPDMVDFPQPFSNDWWRAAAMYHHGMNKHDLSGICA